VDYLGLHTQATRAAKWEFLRERHQAALGVPGTVLKGLRRRQPTQPHYLDRKLGGRMAPG